MREPGVVCIQQACATSVAAIHQQLLSIYSWIAVLSPHPVVSRLSLLRNPRLQTDNILAIPQFLLQLLFVIAVCVGPILSLQ
jgi:hypothetical protein